jgi:hypothetical protein
MVAERELVVNCTRRDCAATCCVLRDTVGMNKIAEVLEALREEHRQLSAELSRVGRAIAALEEATGEQPALVSATTVAAPAGGLKPAAPPVPPRIEGPYSLLRFNEAAAAFLASVKEPQTARQIADALIAGGFPTRSKDFRASVRTMLHRTSACDGIAPTTDFKWRSTRGSS